MRLIQVHNTDGIVGLYRTERSDNEKVDQDIKDAFAMGEAKQQHYKEMDYEEEIDVQTEADENLENKGIFREWLDELYI